MSKPGETPKLKQTLGPFMLWGLGVGYVISGMYFGWNLGLEKGGTYGLALATFFVIIMYLTFTFSYTEMACAIPKAGGTFDYTTKALGRHWGFLAGMAQSVEFIFAPPAIAAAIGAYFSLFLPSIDPVVIAIVAYLLFTGLNIAGVKAAATFELVITILAVMELLIFAGVTLPHFESTNLSLNALPHGWGGAFAAIPFAIWFFLAIEGVANVAEETYNPQKNILIGFGSAIFTLVGLCIIVFLSAVGVAGWEAVVYPEDSTNPSDSPLPLALGLIVGENHFLFHLLISIGLLGLIASFHGIILAAGRATYEMGRVKYIWPYLGRIHPRFRTPANALLINMMIGIVAILTGKTGEIITIACFGALSLYIISMVAFFTLRKKHPQLPRPFKVPFYPLFPALALLISSIALVAMSVYNIKLLGIFLGIVLCSYGGFVFYHGKPKKTG